MMVSSEVGITICGCDSGEFGVIRDSVPVGADMSAWPGGFL